MLSEHLAMEDEDVDKSVFGTSTAGCGSSGSGGLVYSPGSCLSSGYCSDDTRSGHDDVFFGRHGKDCWMSSADIDTVDLLRGSLPPFDAELCSATSSAAGVICHDAPVDSAVKFDDVVDNWLFNSMSVPSPRVDDDWPLPPPALSSSTSEEMDNLPTDSVLADLLLNQSAYTAASTHLTRPEVEVDNTMPSAVTKPTRRPETVTTSGACQTENTSISVISATKRMLDVDSCESSAARRHRSSPCRGCCHVPEVTSSSTLTAAVGCDCSTESVRRRSWSTTEVDLSRLSALRPEWPGFADVVATQPVCPPELSSNSDHRSKAEPLTKNSDVEERVSDVAGVSAESSRTETSRPVVLEALLRSASKLDASKGSSGALCDQLVAAEDASQTNQEPRLLHRLLRGELDEADIHRAAEQAAAAAAAAADQQLQQQLDREAAAPDDAESREGWMKQRCDDDVRLFAELASYCNTMTSDDQATMSIDHDVDDIVATIQVPVGCDGDDWLRRYLGDMFSCSSR